MPKAPDVSAFSFRTATLLDADRAVLLAGHRELEASDVPNTFVFVWRRKGEWAGWRVAWNSGSVSSLGDPPQTVFVGEAGQIGTLSPEGLDEQIVGERRVLRSVSRIADSAFAVGLRGAFYRRRPGGAWVPHEPDLGREADIEALAGTSEDDLVAVGWKGQVWHITPGDVARLDCGTNVILTSVCVGGDGFYYGCGQRGVVLRGRGRVWETVDHESTSEDLWNVIWFRGALYVSSLQFLYRLEEGRLVRVDFDGARVLSCYHLSSHGDRVLWSIGSDDVMEFDGSRWRRILGVGDALEASDR